MFESVPTYPKPDRFWEIIERYKVSIFYTAPTVIRSLMRESMDYINSHDLSSLRLLGSVGEPSILRSGSGITRTLAKASARSWIPGGRLKPAAS